jgi:hypothetical protein
MPTLNRLVKAVISAIAQELNPPPANDFNGLLSVANYQDDRHEAVVSISIRPGKLGQVKYQGSWWNARCAREVTLMPGQTVYIVSRRDNTLYVEPGFLLRAMMPLVTPVPQATQETV